MSKGLDLVLDALKKEGKIENGAYVVPNDFFSRLNAELNEAARWNQFFARVTK